MKKSIFVHAAIHAVWACVCAGMFFLGMRLAANPTFFRGKPLPSVNAEMNHDMLVGAWRGEVPLQGGGSKAWLNERSGNGTYIVTFRTVSAEGDIEISQEYGMWGLSGDVYFTKMLGRIKNGEKHPSGASAYYDDAYLVQSLAVNEFVYMSVITGEVYRAKRVAHGELLP